MPSSPPDFSNLSAVFINATLKRSPDPSNTDGLITKSADIMRSHGVAVTEIRAIDHQIATGVYPDMTEHGWDVDEWPGILDQIMAAEITGNEDGIKHCAMNILYSLQHVGFTIPPQADAGWIGEAGPGPSYLDEGSGGPENDFTNRNTTFMTYNLLHAAKQLKDAGGIPAYGNQRTVWDSGVHNYAKDSGSPNPEYR